MTMLLMTSSLAEASCGFNKQFKKVSDLSTIASVEQSITFFNSQPCDNSPETT